MAPVARRIADAQQDGPIFAARAIEKPPRPTDTKRRGYPHAAGGTGSSLPPGGSGRAGKSCLLVASAGATRKDFGAQRASLPGARPEAIQQFLNIGAMEPNLDQRAAARLCSNTYAKVTTGRTWAPAGLGGPSPVPLSGHSSNGLHHCQHLDYTASSKPNLGVTKMAQRASNKVESLNILVIDDEADLRQMFERLFNGEQHQVVLAASAEEGLQLLPHWTFHIAFVDHRLPGMEGLVLGEYLRRNNPDMSIVMMTGSTDPRIERRSRDLRSSSWPSRSTSPRRSCGRRISHLGARTRVPAPPQRRPRVQSPARRVHRRRSGKLRAARRSPIGSKTAWPKTIKRCLNDLTTAARYNERDRVMALSGLLTARVLGVSLPRAKSGITLFEEYDRLMLERGRRPEFRALRAN